MLPPHGRDNAGCAAVCKTAVTESCMRQGSIPGSGLLASLARCPEWIKEKIWLLLLIFTGCGEVKMMATSYSNSRQKNCSSMLPPLLSPSPACRREKKQQKKAVILIDRIPATLGDNVYADGTNPSQSAHLDGNLG